MGEQFPPPEGVYGCCWTAVNSGDERCDCWRPVLDVDPSAELQEGPMLALRRSCIDCAYRAGSPERAASDPPEFGRHEPFTCHQGMPRAIAFVHPSGARIDLTEDDYQPTILGDRVWLADGRPGELCAGWAAVHRIRREVLS